MAIRTELLVLLVPGPVAHRPLLLHNVDVDEACLSKLARVVDPTIHFPTDCTEGPVEKLVEAAEGAVIRKGSVV